MSQRGCGWLARDMAAEEGIGEERLLGGVGKSW